MNWIDNLLEPEELEEEDKKIHSVLNEELIWNPKTGELEIVRTVENYNSDGIIISIFHI